MTAGRDSRTEPQSASGAPVVSVILIYYNAERFLAEAIESVLAQTFTGFELLLVDDGSSDGSCALVQRFAEAHPDRIRCFQHPGGANRGMSATRNLGVRNASGEFIAFIDADDRWRSTKLAEQISVFDRHPEVDAVFGAVNYWRSWAGGSDRLVPTGNVQDVPVAPPEALLKVYPLGRAAAPCPSDILIRREVALAIGGFEESFTGMYEDQVFFAKLYLRHTVYFNSRNWLDYRIHDRSCGAAVSREGSYKAFRAKFLDWLGAYLNGFPIAISDEVRRSLADAQFRLHHPWIARAAALANATMAAGRELFHRA